ncbi:MAG: glutamine amidotransferase [Alphaproteobacteria bacterium]|nr:glutamine amidotransferase [Alphaproteobacteria bacterium]
MKKALVYIHEYHEDHAAFGEVLHERKFSETVVHVPSQDAETDTSAYDLLMVMGGPMGVYEAERYPFLHKEIRALEQRLAKDLPAFGVCLGSQLMAAALGAKVYKGSNGKEIGWHPLSINEEGKKGPARNIDARLTNMFHWHGDTFDLPGGAVLLGSSELYKNQVYSYGKNAFALQCHPEVTASQLEDWYPGYNKEYAGKPPIPLEDLRKNTAQYADTMNAQAKKFFAEWLESVGL